MRMVPQITSVLAEGSSGVAAAEICATHVRAGFSPASRSAEESSMMLRGTTGWNFSRNISSHITVSVVRGLAHVVL